MSLLNQILKENSVSLLDERDEALLEMKHLLNSMITELNDVKRKVEYYIDEPDELPTEHNLSLKNNNDFFSLYQRYHEIILNDL